MLKPQLMLHLFGNGRMNPLGTYIKRRANELQMSLAELSRRANISRQTIYAIANSDLKRLPDMQTLVDLAVCLRVHPLRLIQLVFDDYKLPTPLEKGHARRGDKSVFVGDVTHPDGDLVMANAVITKVWESQNVGTVPWEGRVLRCMDEELVVYSLSGERLRITEGLVPEEKEIPVPTTRPGETVRLAIRLRTPAIPGTYFSYWKTFFADGTQCFPKSVGLSVKVRVVSMRSTLHGESA
jgi:transcriptional regulator with XRE-family HTH domain